MKSPDKASKSRSGGVPEPYREDRGERIQKILAQLGLGSRRQIETWIAEGRIRVNGRIAKLGDRLCDSDELSLNGRPIDLLMRWTQPTRVLVYYK
ncbi:MAG: S4 domain-containing protein, partial [Methylococcales bacterium]